MSLPIILFFHFFPDLQVIHIPQFTDRPRFECRQHRALRLAPVGTGAAKFAVVRKQKHFPEIMRHLHRFEVVERKRFDTRRIDDGTTEVQFKHFCKGSRMLAFPGGIGDFKGAQLQLRLQGIHQGRFADTGLTADQRGFILQRHLQGFETVLSLAVTSITS